MKTRSYKKSLVLANVCMRNDKQKDLIWFVRLREKGLLHTYSVVPSQLREWLIKPNIEFKWLSYSF